MKKGEESDDERATHTKITLHNICTSYSYILVHVAIHMDEFGAQGRRKTSYNIRIVNMKMK